MYVTRGCMWISLGLKTKKFLKDTVSVRFFQDFFSHWLMRMISCSILSIPAIGSALFPVPAVVLPAHVWLGESHINEVYEVTIRHGPIRRLD